MTGWRDLSALSPQRRAAMEFLENHLPASDLDCYPFELFLRFADHALFLRESAPWCGALEEEIFFHYVLFPRVNDEDLSWHRRIFYDALWPRVRDLNGAEEIALEVNRWCHEIASYEPADERTASPLTVFRCGSGRCGEESAFLVSALRSVGVPARQIYVPRWSHCDDNHAWVEALCGGSWRFLGACEPEPVLDRGWFNTAASRAVLVHSRLFGAGKSPLHGAPIGRDGIVTYYNQTSRYAPVQERVFRAKADGGPASGAVFQLQILNEASFHTVAVLTADGRGEARADLGPGTIHVLALLGDLRAEGDCEGGEITLNLATAIDENTDWREIGFHAAPPASVDPAPLNAKERVRRAEDRQKGDALRERRIASCTRSDPAHPAWSGLLRAAKGNGGEILAFLRGENAPDRERLLRTLAPKDLRDTDRRTLEDHFDHLAPKTEEIPEEIYRDCAVCPRIANEKLRPWREALGAWLWDWRGSPGELWERLDREIADVAEGLYPNLCWTPAEALAARRCDRHSKYILFVAALRTMGIPARLRAADQTPEYWENGAFHPIFPERSGALRLTYPSVPAGGEGWSLSRRTDTGWRLLFCGTHRTDGSFELRLAPGQYRLMTAVRMPNGDQLAALRDFSLPVHGEQTLSLRFREYALEDALFSQPMPPLPAVTASGAAVPDIFRLNGRPSLLIWLEEGAEPTEHLLSELAARRRTFQAMPLDLVFLVRGRDSLERRTLKDVLLHWDGVRVFFDDWAFDLEHIARELARDPDTPPLAVLCDGTGRAVYADSGYRVGAAELLARAAGHIAGGYGAGGR